MSQKTKLVLQFSSRSITVVFFLVDCIPFRLVCRCPIVVFIGFSRCFLIDPSMRPGHVLRKPYFIALRRLVVIGLNSAAWNYCANSGLVVCARILFTTDFYCCVIRGTPHIPVFSSLLLLTFVVQFFGLSYLVGIVWWCIHHHIGPPKIWVGLISFWGKCKFVWIF